ncbi:MAG TPA: type II toxin-antitoxin system HicB family antitoxin [Thermoanaerobaculia bacterium]|nr:type II toxin-antitoxin system HicB family antitoxin [Thermoanaerobaculia bacterium]
METAMPINTFTAVFEEAEEGGYIAYIAEVPGATTQGETLAEARENLREAVELVLEANRRLALDRHEGQVRIQERLTIGD